MMKQVGKKKTERSILLSIVILLGISISSCAGFAPSGAPSTAEGGSESGEETLETPELRNELYLDGLKVTMPAGWSARKGVGREDAPLLLLSSADGGGEGRYEYIDLGQGYSFAQFYQHYTATRYSGAESLEVGPLEDTRLEETGTEGWRYSAVSEQRRRFSLLLHDEGSVHLLELTFDRNYEGASHDISVFAQGFGLTGRRVPSRVREKGISFLGSSSGFEWSSDVDGGLVLRGRIAGYPAVIKVYGGAQRRSDFATEGDLSLLVNNMLLDAEYNTTTVGGGKYALRLEITEPAVGTLHADLYLYMGEAETDEIAEMVFSSEAWEELWSRELQLGRRSTE
jgi:hypothetical protein